MPAPTRTRSPRGGLPRPRRWLALRTLGAAALGWLASAGSSPAPAVAQIWNRTNADGTIEYTNRRPSESGWSAATSRGAARAATSPSAGGHEPRLSPSDDPPSSLTSGGIGASVGGGTFWAREREDGVVEFTNLPPIGGRWKVWLRTGPGKASALRGATDVVPERDTALSRFSRYDRHIQDQQTFFGIPEALIRAVIKTESDFDPNVVSSAGAKGLMQLMPDTARLMGVTDVFDPRQNIMGGARYLQILARRFCRTPAQSSEAEGGERTLVCSYDEKVKVIAGYHAGPMAVEKYGGLPPYETTRAYVTAVLRRYDRYRQLAPGDDVMAER